MATFKIIRTYGAIPCTVTYSILDSSLSVLFTETVTSTPSPSPSGSYLGTPVFAELLVSGNRVRVDLNCCCGVELYCVCSPLNAFYLFKFCVQPDPISPGDFIVTVNI